MNWRNWIGSTLSSLLSLVLGLVFFGLGSFANVSEPWNKLLVVAAVLCLIGFIFAFSAYLTRPRKTETSAPTLTFDLADDSYLRAENVDSDAERLLRARSSRIKFGDVKHHTRKHRRWSSKGG
jgi:Zn-dependent protease with chaperone function